MAGFGPFFNWDGNRTRQLHGSERERALQVQQQLMQQHANQQQRHRRAQTHLQLNEEEYGYGSAGGDNEDEDMPDEGSGPAAHPVGVIHPGRTPREYVDRLRAAAGHWTRNRPLSRKAMVAAAPRQGVLNRQRAQQELAALQLQINTLAANSEQLYLLADGSVAELAGEVTGWRTVNFLSLSCSGTLQVPQFTASAGLQGELPAAAAGCFGTAPVRPGLWLQTDLLDLYYLLHMANGIAATAFCKVVERLHSGRSVLQGSAVDTPAAVTLDDRQFGVAYHQYRLVRHDLLNPEAYGCQEFYPGIYGHCAACAHLPEGVLAVSSAQLKQRLQHAAEVLAGLHNEIQPDGVQRTSQPDADTAATGLAEVPEGGGAAHGAAAAPTADVSALRGADDSHSASNAAAVGAAADRGRQPQPRTPVPFSAPDALRQAAGEPLASTGGQQLAWRPTITVSDGCQKLNHFASRGKVASAVLTPVRCKFFGVLNDRFGPYLHSLGRPTTTAPSACTADLAAARPYSTRRAVATDICTTITNTCAHSVPGKGLFISSPVAECFPAYDLQLTLGILPEGGFDAFVMDTNCQHAAHFRNCFPGHAPDGMRWHIGWLHSQAGHGLACQLEFSSMYAEGMGRAIGENPEQLHVS